MYILVYKNRPREAFYICNKIKYVYQGKKRMKLYNVTSLTDNWKAVSYYFPINNNLKIIKINEFRSTVFLNQIKQGDL